MDFLKKHVVNIIFAVIALGAIVGTFYPLGGYFDKLKADVTERATKYKAAQDVLNRPHEMPVVSVGQDSGDQQRPVLGMFPTPQAMTLLEKFMGQIESQSRAVFVEAVRLNKEECAIRAKPQQQMLLVPN